MDSLTRTEFNLLFERVCKYVDMKGAYSPDEIDERMSTERRMMKTLAKKAKSERRRRKWKGYSKQMRKLTSHGFSDRAFDEAMAHPRGKIALTLQHGLKRAKEIILRRKEKRMGELKRKPYGSRY